MLDLYFAGTPPPRLAQMLGRNPKAVRRRLEQFTYNEREWVSRYQPRRRLSRQGKKLTENERRIIKAHAERKIAFEETAKLLQRPVSDFHKDLEGRVRFQEMKKFGPGVDLLFAYRYLYYVKGISMVSDHAYDELEKEEIEFGSQGRALKVVGSDCADDYPLHIRALALYLAFKYGERK